MKNRKLARFLTLTAASVASLCVGAYLSFEAAERQDPQVSSQISEDAPELRPVDIRADIRLEAENPSRPEPLADSADQPQSVADARAEEQAQNPAEDQGPAPSAGPRASLLANLEARSRLIFSPADPGAMPMELRGGDAVAAFVEPSIVEASLRPAPDLDTVLEPSPDMGPATPPASRSAPLPHARPASLPVRSSTLAAVAPALVEAAAPPQSAAGAFPGIADALAAMTASVGGEPSGAFSPQEGVPATPAPPGMLHKGLPVYVRIFKQEGALELWMKSGDHYALYKSFQICKWSGRLGPKLRFADYQSPEGFYSVSSRQLNPHSAYHLAFDIGYPNAYDRRHGATGNAIMVHGDCKSVGCFAMTNRGIDEIYQYVSAALANGQREVPVHIFPFRMTEEAIARESGASPSLMAFLAGGAPRQDWSPFWRNLKEGYDLFERGHVPPVAFACGDRYEFGAGGGSCARIAGR